MEFIKFVRKPFIVDAVEVTLENIEEISKLVGELREKDGKPFIQVNRNVVPGVYRVHPGYWMTRMGDNIRCYNKRVFSQQFCENTEEIENWVNYIREEDEAVEEVVPSLDDHSEAVEESETSQPQVEVVVNGGA